jgi:hypothetical protein
MISVTQLCPIYKKSVEPSQRYPRYVCRECVRKACSQDGRPLEFNNLRLSGGFVAQFTDTGEIYSSHDCYIDGVKFYADYAHFGGIVIQIVTDYKEDSNEKH